MTRLEWSTTEYEIWRCPVGYHASDQAFAVLRTPDETTVVCEAGENAPAGVPVSGPWRLFRIAGQLPHDAVGIMARLSAVLAHARVPIFALSSYDTDYVLVHEQQASAAQDALSAAGYQSGRLP